MYSFIKIINTSSAVDSKAGELGGLGLAVRLGLWMGENTEWPLRSNCLPWEQALGEGMGVGSMCILTWKYQTKINQNAKIYIHELLFLKYLINP